MHHYTRFSNMLNGERKHAYAVASVIPAAPYAEYKYTIFYGEYKYTVLYAEYKYTVLYAEYKYTVLYAEYKYTVLYAEYKYTVPYAEWIKYSCKHSLKGFFELVLVSQCFEFPAHHLKKFVELDGAVGGRCHPAHQLAQFVL